MSCPSCGRPPSAPAHTRACTTRWLPEHTKVAYGAGREVLFVSGWVCTRSYPELTPHTQPFPS